MPDRMPTEGAAPSRPLRADARHNRRRLLEAARDVFIERGPGAPVEEIARRAGTGIATLYRHFPDRQALMREVVIDALLRTIEEARRAGEEEPDPFRALARYMHRAIDERTAAVIPALLGRIPVDDEEIARARETGSAALQALVDAAHQAGTLRPDVTSGDIGMLIVRLSRPLPGGFPAGTNNSLGHRHLGVVIDGLRPAARQPAQLAGPALSVGDLRQFTQTRGRAPESKGSAARVSRPVSANTPQPAQPSLRGPLARRGQSVRWPGDRACDGSAPHSRPGSL